jgi:hypothetical protein
MKSDGIRVVIVMAIVIALEVLLALFTEQRNFEG